MARAELLPIECNFVVIMNTAIVFQQYMHSLHFPCTSTLLEATPHSALGAPISTVPLPGWYLSCSQPTLSDATVPYSMLEQDVHRHDSISLWIGTPMKPPIYGHHNVFTQKRQPLLIAGSSLVKFTINEAKRGIYIYIYMLASFVQVSHRWHQILNFQQTRPPNKHKHLHLHCQTRVCEKSYMWKRNALLKCAC